MLVASATGVSPIGWWPAFGIDSSSAFGYQARYVAFITSIVSAGSLAPTITLIAVHEAAHLGAEIGLRPRGQVSPERLARRVSARLRAAERASLIADRACLLADIGTDA
ncbi:MAG: hypothetical protein ACREYD_13210 [Casimicrobiaceae bacterium]